MLKQHIPLWCQTLLSEHLPHSEVVRWTHFGPRFGHCSAEKMKCTCTVAALQLHALLVTWSILWGNPPPCVTKQAADDLQDPWLSKIILKKFRTIAPVCTSPVYWLGMWKLMKFNLQSHEQGPAQSAVWEPRLICFGEAFFKQVALWGHHHHALHSSKAVNICQEQ